MLEGLKEFDGDIIEVKKKLVAKYGEDCLKPFSEEELAQKHKTEFLPTYLKGHESTDEFKEFYYGNDLQEQILKQIKEQSVEQYKEEKEAFDRDFPSLSPEKSPPKSGADTGIWEVSHVFRIYSLFRR